jgi:hypothetical protein
MVAPVPRRPTGLSVALLDFRGADIVARMRAITPCCTLFIVGFLSATPALARASHDAGFELGVRTGYAFAAGHTGAAPRIPNNTDQDVSTYVSGQWPLWLDLGYRFNASLYLGGYFQYGFGFVNDDSQSTCRNANVNCSASDVRLGLMGRYHFTTPWQASPWVGYGLGWEWGSFSNHTQVLDQDWTWSGLEIMNLQLGADIKLPHGAVVAPFISFSVGRFENLDYTTTTKLLDRTFTQTDDAELAKKSMHEWILIGVRIAVMP